MKKKKTIIVVLGIIIVIATFFIGIGIYFNNLSKPENIFSIAISKIDKKISKYFLINDDLNIGDTVEIKGNLDFDLDSEYLKNHKNDTKINKKINLINNLNTLDTTFLLQQDKKKQIANLELNQKLGKEELLNTKLYIANSTKYYYLKDIDDNYINSGGINYFENINKTNNTRDNINYIHNFIISSIKNNLKKEYFNSKEEKILINKQERKAYETTIKIDDKTINEIIDGVCTDIKKDKRASSIINNIDKNILKQKLKQKILKQDEYYMIHIYTTRIIHRPLKYQIEHVYKNNIDTYVYEGNNFKGKVYYMKNNLIKYQGEVNFKNNDILCKLYDSNHNSIGEFRLEKNKYDTTINYSYDYNNKKIDFIYSSKYTNIKTKKSFDNKQSASFKYIDNKESKINGDIYLNLNVSNKPDILIDTSQAILKTNLTDKQKEILKTKGEKIKERIEK
ncbi:MAG: hypothetical protein IJ097_02655 [Bacilli bacterium]|nr:hypothetical protein [Bacilli bacterium]